MTSDDYEDAAADDGDPTAGFDLSALHTYVEDQPDIRIPYRDEDYRDGTIEVDWYADDDGNVHVKLTADAVVHIDEIGGDDGPVYVSRLFKGRKPKLKDAIGLALRNEVNRVFLNKWAKKNPKDRTTAREAMSINDENERLRRELAEREAKLAALLGPDWDKPDPKAGSDHPTSSAASPGSKGSDGRFAKPGT